MRRLSPLRWLMTRTVHRLVKAPCPARSRIIVSLSIFLLCLASLRKLLLISFCLFSPRKSLFYLFYFSSGRFHGKDPTHFSDVSTRDTRKKPFELSGTDDWSLKNDKSNMKGHVRASNSSTRQSCRWLASLSFRHWIASSLVSLTKCCVVSPTADDGTGNYNNLPFSFFDSFPS